LRRSTRRVICRIIACPSCSSVNGTSHVCSPRARRHPRRGRGRGGPRRLPAKADRHTADVLPIIDYIRATGVVARSRRMSATPPSDAATIYAPHHAARPWTARNSRAKDGAPKRRAADNEGIGVWDRCLQGLPRLQPMGRYPDRKYRRCSKEQSDCADLFGPRRHPLEQRSSNAVTGSETCHERAAVGFGRARSSLKAPSGGPTGRDVPLPPP